MFKVFFCVLFSLLIVVGIIWCLCRAFRLSTDATDCFIPTMIIMSLGLTLFILNLNLWFPGPMHVFMVQIRVENQLIEERRQKQRLMLAERQEIIKQRVNEVQRQEQEQYDAYQKEKQKRVDEILRREQENEEL